MRNAGNTFQQLIDRPLTGVESSSPYLDDILVFSKGDHNHRQTLQEALEQLRAAGLTANPENCEFNKPAIEFPGHTISATGIAPLLAAITAHRHPNNIRELQNFLGVINLYRKIVPGAACVRDCQVCSRAKVTCQPVPTSTWISWAPSPLPRRASGTCSPS
jgi:hypothetical protein